MKHGKDRLHIATKKHPGKWVSLAEKDKSVISVSDNAKKVYADAKK